MKGRIWPFSNGILYQTCLLYNTNLLPYKIINCKHCLFDGIKNGNFSFYSYCSLCHRQILVSNCSFRNGEVGIAIFIEATIRDCSFSNFREAFRLGHFGCIGKISNCQFTNVDFGIYDNGGGSSRLEMQSSEFSDVHRATFLYAPFLSGGFIRNCILDKSAQYVVALNQLYLPDSQNTETLEIPPNEEYRFDISNNYWGTAEKDSIQAWILDGNGVEEFTFYFDWQPFKQDSVPVERETMDSFKALYR
ncbi:MAG: hypothetical protein GY780_03090 [bacterium]|nr:hypothetical protein [bacterium]